MPTTAETSNLHGGQIPVVDGFATRRQLSAGARIERLTILDTSSAQRRRDMPGQERHLPLHQLHVGSSSSCSGICAESPDPELSDSADVFTEDEPQQPFSSSTCGGRGQFSEVWTCEKQNSSTALCSRGVSLSSGDSTGDFNVVQEAMMVSRTVRKSMVRIENSQF